MGKRTMGWKGLVGKIQGIQRVTKGYGYKKQLNNLENGPQGQEVW